MRIRTILRTNAGVWLTLPLTLLAVAYIANFTRSADPYPVAVTAAGLAALGFVVPICAALGAWEGGRLRRGGTWDLPTVRSRYVIAAWALGPVVAAGCVSVVAAVLTSTLASGVTVPDWRPLLVAFLVVLAHSAAGFALGILVPTAVAVSVSLLASFVWMVFLRGLDPMWLRYLNGGAIELCCDISTDVAPTAVAGPLVVAIGLLAAAGLTLATTRAGLQRRALALSPLLIALVIGSMLVSELSAYPAVPRDERQLLCSDRDQIRICVWPEHEPRFAEVVGLATTASAGWLAAGVSAPTLFTEGHDGDPPDALKFSFALRSSPSVIVSGFAYAMLPPWPTCADFGPYLGFEAFEYVNAWYAAHGGLPQDDLRSMYLASSGPDRPPVIELVDQVLAQPLDVQRRWLAANVVALESCDMEPQLSLSAPDS